jgi:hypothetical protein
MTWKVFIFALFSSSLIAGNGINLLKNPGFEQGTKHWTIYSGSKSGPRFSVDRSVVHSGEKALRWDSKINKGNITAFQNVKLTPGRMYKFSGWLKTDNLRGSRETGASICIELLDQNGKVVPWSGFYPGGLRGTRGWWHLTSYTNKLGHNIFGPVKFKNANVMIYLRKRKKAFTGKAWWDDLRLEPVSMTCHILKPAYKMTAPDNDPALKLEFETWPEDFDLKLNQTELYISVVNNAEKTVLSKIINPEQKHFTREFCLRKLRYGSYKLSVVFRRKQDSSQLWKQEFPIKRIASFKNYPVYIDNSGKTIVNNKPFLPLGIYTRNVKYSTNGLDLQAQYRKYIKSSPFNTVLCYDMFPPAVMKEFGASDKKVILSVKDYFNAIWYHPKTFHCEKDEVKAIKKVVNKWKRYPALFAWYTNDEKGLELLKNHQEHYYAVNKTDPGHPSFNLHNNTADMSEMINCCDAIGIDVYPVPRKPLSLVAEEVKHAQQAVGYSRPVWAVLQISNLGVHYGKRMPEGRPPTDKELRAMSWLALCNGANGIIYYCFHDMLRDKKYAVSEYWKKYCRVVKEISLYSDIILSSEKCPEVKFTDNIIKTQNPYGLYWRTAVYKGSIYVFAVKDDSGECSAKLAISHDIENLQVMTLGNNEGFKTLHKTKGCYTDYFRKCEVKVYKGKLIK